MLAQSKGDGPFIDVERLDMNKYARRDALSRVLCDYLFYHEGNPRKAAELAAAATKFVSPRILVVFEYSYVYIRFQSF